MKKEQRERLFEQALLELEPYWRHFDELEIYQWAWEFLKRNRIYKKVVWRLTELPKDSWLYHRLINLVIFRFGLTYPLCPSLKMEDDQYWNYKLLPKTYSDLRLKEALRGGNTISNLELFDEEEAMIINFNVPYQVYEQELKKRYEKRGKLKQLPQFQVSKFPEMIKMYDLRNWSLSGRRAIRKGNELHPSISWAMIGQYLSPKTPYTTQMLRKRYAATEKYIHGHYLELLKHKGSMSIE